MILASGPCTDVLVTSPVVLNLLLVHHDIAPGLTLHNDLLIAEDCLNIVTFVAGCFTTLISGGLVEFFGPDIDQASKHARVATLAIGQVAAVIPSQAKSTGAPNLVVERASLTRHGLPIRHSSQEQRKHTFYLFAPGTGPQSCETLGMLPVNFSN